MKLAGIVLVVLVTAAMWFSGIERYQVAAIRGATIAVGLSLIAWVAGRFKRNP